MTARRRQSSTKPVRARVHDGGVVRTDPATVRRLEVLETTVETLEQAIAVVTKRVSALQAHIDHVAAKLIT